MKKGIRILIGSIMIFALAFCVLTACRGDGDGNGNGQNGSAEKITPTYKGMTIVRNSAGGSAGSLSSGVRNADADASFTVEDDTEFSEDMEDLITIEVETDDEVKYYVSAGETYIVQVHLSNPDRFEIQSFTLNGEKFANYMFKDGSTMELLLLEVTAPTTSGYTDLTIDAIKYIDGTEIKDVRMDGSQTIKAGVAYANDPSATVSNVVIGTTSISLDVEITDDDGIVRMDTAKIYLTDGENHIYKQLIRGVNNITFDNLVMGKRYKYGVVVNYDKVDGRGDQAHWLVEDGFNTLKAFNVTEVKIGQEKIDFTVEKTGSVGEIKSIKLLETNGTEVQSLADLSQRKFENLSSNHEYKIEIAFNYSVSGEETTDKTTIRFKTLAKTMPTVTVENVASTQTSVTFDVATTDADNILNITEVGIYKGITLVKAADEVTEREFTELLSNNGYRVQVTYVYDLNDGAGVRIGTASATVTTVAKTAPTVAIKDFVSTQTTLSFSVETEDADNILTVEDVRLYDGETLVKALDKTETSFEIGELQSGTTYTVKVEFTYDLNDGEGVRRQTAAVNQPTLVESVAVSEMALVNNSQIKLGEELNLGIYFDNPSKIYLVNIYVNGIKTQVSGGDRRTYAIVKFIPDEAGLVDFYVDKVEYNFNDVLVAQAVDSPEYITFPVFNDLDVRFEGVTASPYEYTGEGIYLTFDNPHGYKVYKINDRSDFTEISDNRFYIDMGRLGEHKIESVKYGYDNYGATTQAFTYSLAADSSGRCTFYSAVYTSEDFLNMTETGYYVLMNDLDLREVGVTETIRFRYLNGNGHTIRGLHNVIDTASQNYYDIFSAKSIFDVNFTELYFSYVNNKSEGINVSLLGGVSLYNCTLQGDVNTSGEINYFYSADFYDDETCQRVFGASLTEQYGDSNTFDLGITKDGVYSQETQTGKRLPKNESVVIEDGILYYTCGGNARIMLGRFDRSDLVNFVVDDDVVEIRNWGNIANDKLETVVIGNGLRGAICGPFSECAALTSVTIGDNVTVICERTFQDCANLTSLTIGNGVTVIGYRAFYGCVGLTSVVIPDGVTEIGNEAFRGCAGLTDVTIGEGVKTIGECAFYECEKLESVVIPDGVESVEYAAFYGCEKLAEVTIGDGVTDIGNAAFQYCKGITSLSIGNGVKRIGDYAFSYCYGLTSAEIPESVTKIAPYAFNFCSELTSVTIGEGVKSIGREAFSCCCKLSSVTMECRIESIENSVFYGCAELTDIEIPDSVKSIGNNVFFDCGKLSNVEIPDGVTAIGDSAFNGCAALTTLEIPDSVTDLGEYAFYNCTALTSLKIGNGLKVISNYAFNYCSKLTSVTIGSGVTTIGENAFYGCVSLPSIEIPDNVIRIEANAFHICYNLTSVEIGNGVTSIGKAAFYGCTALPSVAIPAKVTDIGESAFRSCSKLASLTIPEGVISIGPDAFQQCSKLASVEIPVSLKSIGSYAFNACPALSAVYITDLAKWCEISFANGEANPLSQAHNLYLNGVPVTELKIPDRLTSIGDNTFYGLTALTSVVIGNNVTEIGNYAFRECSNITTLVLGKNVKTIGGHAFNGCSALAKVYYYGTEASWNGIQINPNGNNATLKSAARYYYSQYAPATPGNYWHYNSNGKLLEW